LFVRALADLFVSKSDEVKDCIHVEKGGEQMNKDMDTKISRRTLLKGAAVVTGMALVSALTGKALAAKSTKAAMQYQDQPKGDQKCSNCTLFVPGKTATASGTCQVVEGSISPQGWCTAYVKKS